MEQFVAAGVCQGRESAFGRFASGGLFDPVFPRKYAWFGTSQKCPRPRIRGFFSMLEFVSEIRSTRRTGFADAMASPLSNISAFPAESRSAFGLDRPTRSAIDHGLSATVGDCRELSRQLALRADSLPRARAPALKCNGYCRDSLRQ